MSTGRRDSVEPGFVGTPVLTIPLELWQTMMSYIHACPVEVNGFGYVTRTGPMDFRVSKIFILDQEATMTTANVSEAVLHRHLFEMVQAGRSTGDMRLQWHSHVNMDAYFSGTDTANIERYASGWMLSLVANKYGEYEARIDCFEPFRFWSPLEVRIELPSNDVMLTRAREEIHQKVKTPGVFWPGRIRPDQTPPPVQVVDPSSLGE